MNHFSTHRGPWWRRWWRRWPWKGASSRGHEDFVDGPHLAEDAQHAAAAQQQDEAQRDADLSEADNGEGDYDEVEDAPAVGDEATPLVGEDVEEQLGREGNDQDKVNRVQDRPSRGA